MSIAIDKRLALLDKMLSGKRLLCDLERKGIERQISDLRNPPDGIVWSETAATNAENLFENLKHWKGEWHGTKIVLEDWQRQCIVAPLFGWLRDDGRRRFTTAYIEVPRKNGKTTLIAGIGIQGLCADGEHGAEVYAAATQRDQAALMFTDAKNMIAQHTGLSKYCKVYKNSVLFKPTNSIFKPVSSEGNSLHGLNCHRNLIDELHAHKTRTVWDVLTTGTGSRRNPMTVAITTAGFDRSTICWEQREYSRNVLEGSYTDDRYFSYISGAEDDDDFMDPAVWAKANPNLGISVKTDYIEELAGRAKNSPAQENTFRMLHLNQWMQQSVRWIPMHAWDACEGDSFPRDKYQGRRCCAGLDLASTRDVNSLVLAFQNDDGSYDLLPFFWAPEAVNDTRGQQDRRQVLNWGNQGEIKLTSGNVTDYEVIVQDIMALSREFQIDELLFDTWGPAQSFVQRLTECGFRHDSLREFRQTIGNFSSPTREFERLVLSKKIRHHKNPVLRWMVGNTAVRMDPIGNIRPDKENSADKIDGVVAAIMALAGAMDNGQEAGFLLL